MIFTTKCIKLQTRVGKKLVKTKKLYGFKSLSETIDYLMGNDKVNKLLKEQEPITSEDQDTYLEKGETYDVVFSNKTKDIC